MNTYGKLKESFMKIALLAAVLSFTPLAHAHQYIQCASTDIYSSDRTVINLDGEKSTLFMTTGVNDPNEIRILKSIKFLRTQGDKTLYQSSNHESTETVILPTAIIGKNARNFNVTVELVAADGSLRLDSDLVCYSALYDNK